MCSGKGFVSVVGAVFAAVRFKLAELRKKLFCSAYRRQPTYTP